MEITRPHLALFGRYVEGHIGAHHNDISEVSIGWSRSIRRNGGYWRGSLTIPADKGINILKLFDNGMGYHFSERTGGIVTWEGLIYEMDLIWKGSRHRRSFAEMFNHVNIYYTDETNTSQNSSAAENSVSISKYGRREYVDTLTGQPAAVAEQQRDTTLLENSYPNPYFVDHDSGEDQLILRPHGYIWTANWRYESAGDGTTDTVDGWMTEIVQTDCEFLGVGAIASNTKSIKKAHPAPKLALDQIADLNDAGIDGNPTRYYVGNKRRFYYEQISTTPSYFDAGGVLYPASEGGKYLEASHIAAKAWLLKPGVVRFVDYPIASVQYQGWLQQKRDYYMDEVWVTDNGPDELPSVDPSTYRFKETELQRESLRFESIQEQMEKQK